MIFSKLKKNKSSLDIEFISKLSIIEEVVNLSNDLLDENNIQTDRFAFKLILFEVLTNAVEHGNKLDLKLKVNYNLIINKEEIQIKVKDEGCGFDWQKALNNKKCDINSESGRGFLLMNSYGYTPSFNKLGNEITVIKKITENFCE